MEPLRFDGADVPVERRATTGSGQEFDTLTAAARVVGQHSRAFVGIDTSKLRNAAAVVKDVRGHLKVEWTRAADDAL
jgi:hypothetical protein